MRLTAKLLISAYAQGIFPMGVDGTLQWFDPDPRAIIPLDTFHVPKTLAQLCRKNTFEIRVNAAFHDVMLACADRKDGSWITDEIIRAYVRLHRLGVAHSVECWRKEKLAGGLYGVALGGAFFGESMFHHERDASKVALVALVHRMRERGYSLLDTQFMTDHLARFGALEIPRRTYHRRLNSALQLNCRFVD